MVWTVLSFNFGATLSHTEMNQLDANFDALQNGDSGSPKVINAAITDNSVDANALGASSIAQSEAKTATAEQTVLVLDAGDGHAEITPTGGDFSMTPHFMGNDGNVDLLPAPHESQYSAIIAFFNSFGADKTGFLRTRYIQTSPPYDLGDGDIPLFILLVVEKSSGRILQTSVAEDPPWFAHGSHGLGSQSKLLKSVGLWGVDLSKTFMGLNPTMSPDELRPRLQKLRDFTDEEKNKIIKRKWTRKEKNIDMLEVPHIFNDYDANTQDLIIVDPVSNFADDMRALNKLMGNSNYQDGGVANLFLDGYIKLIDIIYAARVPPGYTAMRAKWTNKQRA